MKARVRYGVPMLGLAVLLLAMAWASHRDPFKRLNISLKTQADMKIEAIAVLPKPMAKYATVIYMHPHGETLLTTGKTLRQFAELGMAAVGMEYDENKQALFDDQFRVLQDYIAHQPWAQSNATAWVGFSQGAQMTLRFMCAHPDHQPQLLVRISGGWVQKLDSRLNTKNPDQSGFIHCPVLLVHADNDEVFPVADAFRLVDLLKAGGAPVDLQVIRGYDHAYRPDLSVIFRLVGEYCRSHLPLTDYTAEIRGSNLSQPERDQFNLQMQRSGLHRRELWRAITSSSEQERHALVAKIGALQDYDLTHLNARDLKNMVYGNWVAERRSVADWHWQQFWRWSCYVVPAIFAAGNLVLLWRWWKIVSRRLRRPPAMEPGPGLGTLFIHSLGWLVGTVTILIAAIHLGLPRFPVSDNTISLVQSFLVESRLQEEFHYILGLPTSRGERLGTLLDHLNLADLQRHQFYAALDESSYQSYVLSPIITELPLDEPEWRRTLWENFYPRIKQELDPMSAAAIVVRFLRERVGIDPAYGFQVGVETIWTEQMTDKNGFDRIYVASLRSVGIAARLNNNGQAELLANNRWQPAPKPLIERFEP